MENYTGFTEEQIDRLSHAQSIITEVMMEVAKETGEYPEYFSDGMLIDESEELDAVIEIEVTLREPTRRERIEMDQLQVEECDCEDCCDSEDSGWSGWGLSASHGEIAGMEITRGSLEDQDNVSELLKDASVAEALRERLKEIFYQR